MQPKHSIMWASRDANRDIEAGWLADHAADLRHELETHTFAFVVGTHFSGECTTTRDA